MSSLVERPLTRPTPRVGGARFVRTAAFGGVTALAGRDFETRLPPHVHTTYVLGVVDRGAVQVTVGGQSWLATPGALILLQPFQVHTELPVAPLGWSFRYLYPSEAVVRAALGAGEGDSPSLSFVAPVVNDADLALVLARAHERFERDETLAAEQHLVDLVRGLRDRHTWNPTTGASRDRRNIQLVRASLVAKPLRGVSLADLASAAGLSPFHFCRVFKQDVGLPPYTYYEQVRIAWAHDLIQQGRDLTSVAYELGFADQSHLTRHFHRGSFTTPGQLARLSTHLRRTG